MADMIFFDNTYFLTAKDSPEDRIHVEVGDSKQPDTFYPQAKMCRWDNEVNLSVRLIDDIPEEAIVTDADGIVSWAKPGIESRFYEHSISKEHPEGGFEFEIILKEKPSKNIFQFSIRTKGLDFFYQPALIQQEINEGCRRPENVVGSYAVYHSEKHGDFSSGGGKNYRSGKAFHIFRPNATDAGGKETWCDLHIDTLTGTLQVCIPEDWLAEAQYPVTVDPNFGYESIGVSTSSTAGNFFYGSVFTSPLGILTATSISLYCGGGSVNYVKVMLALHSTLNLISNGVAPAFYYNAPGWWTGTFVTRPVLLESTEYILGAICKGTGPNLYYDSGDADQGHLDDTNSYSSPENLGSVSHSTNKYSVYCTYILPTDISVTETITLTDTVVNLIENLVEVTETITETDSLSVAINYVKYITETLTLTDVLYFRKSLLTITVSSLMDEDIDVDSKITY